MFSWLKRAVPKALRSPTVLEQLADPREHVQAAALEALTPNDPAAVDAFVLEALDSRSRRLLAAAATGAGRRRLAAARLRLEALTTWSPPPTASDYEPESWEEDRLDSERDDRDQERIRTAAREALAALDRG